LFIVDWTPSHLQQLHDKAAACIGESKQTVKQFYRNKPEDYFLDIFRNHRGVMDPYTKDCNGSPGCPINGEIDGLFFSTSAKAPPFSYFGNWRLFVTAHTMLTPDCNMYFADFYCHYKAPYVTVVVTKPGSPSDVFCAAKLLRMDTCDNAFLEWNRGHIRAAQKRSFHIEMLYTESLDIGRCTKAGFGRFDKHVPTKGRGKSNGVGITKNPNCTICNI
jgi:hypothetical protein